LRITRSAPAFFTGVEVELPDAVAGLGMEGACAWLRATRIPASMR
jgi:hypothetical protein